MVRQRLLAWREAYIAGVGTGTAGAGIAGTVAVGIVAEVDTVREGTGAGVAGAVGLLPAEVVVVVGQGWPAAGVLLLQKLEYSRCWVAYSL